MAWNLWVASWQDQLGNISIHCLPKRISLSMILVMSFNGCASQLYNDNDEQLELCVDFTNGCGGSQSESSE